MGKKSHRKAENGMAGSGLEAAPARNAASSVQANGNAPRPGNGVETIALPGGQQIPVAPPPGVDPEMYQQALAYLRANPQVALQTQDQMRRMGSPAMAQLAASRLQDPEYKQKMEQLRDDPDLKPIFDEIAATGTSGMDKYWNDGDLMSRISAKMSQLGVSHEPARPQPAAKSLPVKPTNLHDAAKAGDEAAISSLLEQGCDVNGRDSRGITPLGVAVGFNRLPVVKALLAAGADVALTDAKGNTPLHYAAGYGRKEAAELLLQAGALPTCTNDDDQTPAQVAETNREMHMVEYLNNRAAGKDAAASEAAEADKYV